jgi:hypothetical protein
VFATLRSHDSAMPPTNRASLVLPLLVTLVSTPACIAEPALTVDESELGTTPDEELTPGSLCTDEHPDFDGYRYAEQVPHCRRSVSSSRKNRVYAAYGVPPEERSGYEVDHRISLALGGDNSMTNLWPLLDEDARRKARLEQQLYLDLLHGEITQADAIATILSWQ